MSVSKVTINVLLPNALEEWDKYINAHPNATPYHLSAWCEAVKQAYGFKCQYFVAYINNKIVGCAPIVLMRSLKGKKHLCSLPYCDIGGPLADSTEIQEQLEKHIIQYASEQKISKVELRGTDPFVQDVSDVENGTKVRMLLPLPENSDALMTQFKSKLRSQIRKAEKNGLHFQCYWAPNGDGQEVKDFYQIIAKNMHKLGSPVHSYAWYKAVIDCYAENLCLVIVKYEDISVAAGLVLKCANKAVIPWASTVSEYNRLAPNMLLYWGVLSSACDNGATMFDFGRSTVGEGTFNFKKQWGCKAQTLCWEQLHNGRKIPDVVPGSPSKARTMAEDIWRKIPLSLSTIIGPKVRKYISL